MDFALDSGIALLDELLDARRDRPFDEFLVDARGSRAVRFGELAVELNCRQRQFATWGLVPGERVGVLISAPVELAEWLLAGLRAGLWIAPLDPTVAHTNPQATDHRVHALALSAVVSDLEAPPNFQGRWCRVDGAAASSDGDSLDEVGGGGILLASSGTTGTPKVMALAKSQLLTNARLIAHHHEFVPGDRGFNPLPLWHINAEVVGVLASLSAGSTLVLDDRFHRTGFWKMVRDFNVTWINAVPAIISRLVTLHDGESVPASLRFVRSASAPLSPTLLQRFEAMSGVPVIESYGMTEAASQICANPIGARRRPGSVGPPVGVEVRIVNANESDQAVANGDVGAVEIKGPTVIGAYESAEYAERFSADGWLRTGDLGYFDGDGYLYLVGRSDDVINRGGEKVYPQEIENVLALVGEVARSVVIGEPDEVFGQVPVAYVEFASGLSADRGAVESVVQRIAATLREHLTKAYRPAIIKVVAEIPTHATGKVRKALVRDGDVEIVHVQTL